MRAVAVVQATPMNDDGSLDLQGLRANTEFLVERGRGRRIVLVPTGSTGEAYALSDAARLKVIETVIETAAGRVPVVAGTAKAGTELTIELSRAAQRAGADGVQVVLPYYHVPSEDGMYRHFARLGDALDIGVMVYNNPLVSKLWMPPLLMARCAEHPNIVADKESASDMTQYKAMRDAVDPEQMTVLCGLGDLYFSYAAALGCPGFVTWTANFAPELSLALLDAADRCDFRCVREIASRIGRVYEFVGFCARNRGRDPWLMQGYTAGHTYVAILKAALEITGLAGGPVRGPGDELTVAERDRLEEILREIRLNPRALQRALNAAADRCRESLRRIGAGSPRPPGKFARCGIADSGRASPFRRARPTRVHIRRKRTGARRPSQNGRPRFAGPFLPPAPRPICGGRRR
ncbi:MAG: dihydrodipicolinate synthase family protein [Bryobacteraceae bacterium]|nr:dihydrodipicolinate synthase family protein [Bryobacteraceae bacterium]